MTGVMGFSFFTQDIAMDLGTANTIIIMNGKMVVNEPSIVALNTKTEKVIAIGSRARQMEGRAPENIKTIRPLRGGVIADFNAAEQMIRGMIKMATNGKNKLFSPSLRIVVCIPSGSTNVTDIGLDGLNAKNALTDDAAISPSRSRGKTYRLPKHIHRNPASAAFESTALYWRASLSFALSPSP